MRKILEGFVILVTVLLFIFVLEGFTYYWFLPPELNTALELWKNKPPESEYGYYYAIIADPDGTTSFIDPAPYEDVMAVPTDLKIGETWTGPSGITYIATAPSSTETGAEQINSTLDTTLVPVGGGGGLIETEDISNLKPGDQGSELDPDNTEIGDTFLGPSGTEYILKPENISNEEIEALAQLGFVASGVWVPVQ